MKRFFLLAVMFLVCTCSMTFAEEVITTGTWKKTPKSLREYAVNFYGKVSDGYAVSLTNQYVTKIAVLDNNLNLLRSVTFEPRTRAPIGNGGKPAKGSLRSWLNDNTLEMLFDDYNKEKKCRIITRRSYDLASMQLVKEESLCAEIDLEPNATDLLGGVRMFDFSDFYCLQSENKEYIALITYALSPFRHCVNLAIYDRNFNKIAEAPHLDLFRVPKMKGKEAQLKAQDYDYDVNLDDNGKLTFVRSNSKRFLESDGSDVVVYELSKDGLKQHNFGKPLGAMQYYSPEILQIKDGKILTFGIYAPIADLKEFKLEGSCTIEYDLNNDAVQVLEKVPFETAAKGAWRHDFLSQYNVGSIYGPLFKTSNGWIKILRSSTAKYGAKPYVSFIDERGCIKVTHQFPHSINGPYFSYNDKLYYSVKLKEFIYSIDENGKSEEYAIPYEYRLYDGLMMFQENEEKGKWDFLKLDIGSYMIGTVQIK